MIYLETFFAVLVRFSHQICFNTYKSCFITGFFKMKKSGGETDV